MKASKFRYWIIFMVLLIMTINYIDRGALAYAQQDIIREFGLNSLDMDIFLVVSLGGFLLIKRALVSSGLYL